MTSRRSFLRGFLALPAAAVPTVAAPPPKSSAEVVDGEVHIHAAVVRINGQEIAEYVADRLNKRGWWR